MRSSGPASFTSAYADLRQDAALAEELGFDSLWLAEHHFWYDGWCPQPLVAAASALAVTAGLHGTAMHLLPQHEIATVIRSARTLLNLFGPRLELGVALGYRDEEYDAFGVSARQPGARMSAHLDQLLAEQPGPARTAVWVGGIAEPAIRRAGQRGLPCCCPTPCAPMSCRPGSTGPPRRRPSPATRPAASACWSTSTSSPPTTSEPAGPPSTT
jgi:hypothetical protein